METTCTCAYCGETNDLLVDPHAGSEQEFVEDCQLCCQPNLLTIRVSGEEIEIVVRHENE